MNHIEMMKSWLEVMEYIDAEDSCRDFLFPYQSIMLNNAITALRTAIEAAEKQEPVGEWVDGRGDPKRIAWKPGYVANASVGDKLYTTPPAAPVQAQLNPYRAADAGVYGPEYQNQQPAPCNKAEDGVCENLECGCEAPVQKPAVASINPYELIRSAFHAGIKNDFETLSTLEKQAEQALAAPVQEPDWSESTNLHEIWKNPLIPMAQRLLVADGAVAFERKVNANLRKRLAAPVKVGTIAHIDSGKTTLSASVLAALFATPPVAQRPWVELTPEDIKVQIDESGLESNEYGQELFVLITALDAKLREKNT